VSRGYNPNTRVRSRYSTTLTTECLACITTLMLPYSRYTQRLQSSPHDGTTAITTVLQQWYRSTVHHDMHTSPPLTNRHHSPHALTHRLSSIARSSDSHRANQYRCCSNNRECSENHTLTSAQTTVSPPQCHRT
jgi:hypothetical protein